MYEEDKYCKKTYNNALTTYYILALNHLAPILPGIIQYRKLDQK